MAASSPPSTEPNADDSRPTLPGGASLLAPALGLGTVCIAASWLGYYLITPLPFLELDAFPATVKLHLVTGLVLIPYLIFLIATRRLPGGSVLDVPLVALLGVYLLTTATSLDWRVSLEVTLTALMAIAVFYVLSDGGLLQRWQLEMALMLAMLAAAVKAVWVVGSDYVDWLQLTDAVRGSLSLGDLVPATVPKVHDVGDHPNLLGGILAMSVPFFLVTVLRPLPKAVRALAALAALVVVLAIFLSLTRSAWLAVAAGSLTTVGLLAGVTPGGRTLLRELRPATPQQRFIAGASALLLALAVLVAAFVVQHVQARPLWLFRPSGVPRLDVMQAGTEMIADYPMLGTGPGIYALLYPEYSGQYPNHAFHSHNGFLQTTVDMGALGVLAAAALAGVLTWLLVRGMRKTEGDARLSIVACAGSLAAFATFSLFDAPNGFKGPLVALAAVGAIAVLSLREQDANVERADVAGAPWPSLGGALHMAARTAIPVALAGLLITWGRLDIAHFHYSNGLSNANAQRWPEAVEDAQRAVDLDPQFAIYRFQLGLVQGQWYLTTRNPTLLDEAIGQLEKGLDLEPRSAIGHTNLALLYAEAGERQEARTEALAALEFASKDPAVVLAAGTALEKTNWGDDAVRAYSKALFLDMGLADSSFWSESPFRLARFPDIVGQSAIIFNPCGLLRLTVAGVPAGPLTREEALVACRDDVAAHPGNEDGKVTLAEALIDDGMLDEALVLLDQVLDLQPDHGRARTALGRWYAARGELEKAREQWLRAGQLDEVEALVLLGDSYPAGEVPAEVVDALRSELRLATSQVQFHLTGILYYRFKFFRGSPQTILLPGEWQRAVPGRYARAEMALERWTSETDTP